MLRIWRTRIWIAVISLLLIIFVVILDSDLEDDHSNFTLVTYKKRSKGKKFHNKLIKLKLK